MKTFDPTDFIPGVSLDCVIFGFDGSRLNVLLLRLRGFDEWALPGGFIKTDEHGDDAALRVLKERTGVSDLFLQQFKTFTHPDRTKVHVQELLRKGIIDENAREYFTSRFISLGYYALTNHNKVKPAPDYLSEECAWHPLDAVPELLYDHRAILEEALEEVRLDLQYHPVGQNLLPKKFTMPELQALYEAILDKELDRRNFSRRVMSYGIVEKLDEHRTGMAHKAPRLYKFKKSAYEKALKDGLSNRW